MKKILLVLLSLTMGINMLIPIKAEQNKEKILIGINEASEELLKMLDDNNISYNETTQIKTVEVKNKKDLNETSTALSVTTLMNGVLEQSVIWHFDENGGVLPTELIRNREINNSYGQYTAVCTQSNTIFVGTTRSTYTLYVGESYNQYIRPISAGFSYYYNTGYSGTFNGSYTYYANGPLFSYPSYTLIQASNYFSITVTRNNAVQNVTYTNTAPLPYGQCIGLATFEIGIGIWGVFSGTANGTYFEWYMDALNNY